MIFTPVLQLIDVKIVHQKRHECQKRNESRLKLQLKLQLFDQNYTKYKETTSYISFSVNCMGAY
jgi:hypothetical protein